MGLGVGGQSIWPVHSQVGGDDGRFLAGRSLRGSTGADVLIATHHQAHPGHQDGSGEECLSKNHPQTRE